MGSRHAFVLSIRKNLYSLKVILDRIHRHSTSHEIGLEIFVFLFSQPVQIHENCAIYIPQKFVGIWYIKVYVWIVNHKCCTAFTPPWSSSKKSPGLLIPNLFLCTEMLGFINI